MYQLATFIDLYDQQHELALYCIQCDRWSDVDLKGLIATGGGARRLADTRFRCRSCGSLAEKQLRPPVPETGHAVAYVNFAV